MKGKSGPILPREEGEAQGGQTAHLRSLGSGSSASAQAPPQHPTCGTKKAACGEKPTQSLSTVRSPVPSLSLGFLISVAGDRC